jgi:hypothetical protein
MTHLPRRIAPFPDPLKWHDDRFAVISTVDTKSSANTEIDASIVTFRFVPWSPMIDSYGLSSSLSSSAQNASCSQLGTARVASSLQ